MGEILIVYFKRDSVATKKKKKNFKPDKDT